jgi:hypothetical protein
MVLIEKICGQKTEWEANRIACYFAYRYRKWEQAKNAVRELLSQEVEKILKSLGKFWFASYWFLFASNIYTLLNIEKNLLRIYWAILILGFIFAYATGSSIDLKLIQINSRLKLLIHNVWHLLFLPFFANF